MGVGEEVQVGVEVGEEVGEGVGMGVGVEVGEEVGLEYRMKLNKEKCKALSNVGTIRTFIDSELLQRLGSIDYMLAPVCVTLRTATGAALGVAARTIAETRIAARMTEPAVGA